MGLVRLALGNVYGVLVLALTILVLGFVALVSIPVDILPSFNTPAVQVLTYYNGMPASSIERTITNRIERWVNQAPGVRTVESRSVQGVSVARVFFRDEIDPNAALTMSNSLALGTLPTLPPNTLPPVVLPFDPTGTLPLGILTVSNPRANEAKLKDLARIDVRNMLGSVSGTVAPVVVGGKDRTILLYLDQKKLQSRKIAATDVVKALQDGNLMVTPGTAYFGDNLVQLDSNAMVSNVSELEEIPIRLPSGEVIQLGDVGHAEDSYSIQTSRVRINGKQRVFVPIYRQGGASSLKVAEGVKDAIDDMEARLPEGTKLEYVIDQSEYVRKAVEGLIHEGIIGAILVSLMILIFLGNWKMTLIASLSLPLSILGAIVGLKMTGNTINVMTLGGLFLAIGPLVDNAIVVLENTHRHLGMGKSPMHAARDAAGELTLPVMVATAALIIVLCPVALTPGLGGFLFKPLALAVAFAMLASFLLSWTFVPRFARSSSSDTGTLTASMPIRPNHRSQRLLTPQLAHAQAEAEHRHELDKEDESPPSTFQRIYARIDAGLTYLTNQYSALLALVLRHRVKVLCGIALLFAASLLQLRWIGQEFFPQVDAGQITITVRASSNSRLDATERRIADVEKIIEGEIPPNERTMILSEIGLNPDWSAAYTQNAGQMDTIIRLQLNDNRSMSAQDYAIKLRHAFAKESKLSDLQFGFDTGGMVSAALNFGASSPIAIEVEGGSPEEALEFAKKIREAALSVKGAADVRIQQRRDAPYLVLNVKRQKALEVGLTTRDVILQVVAAMNSSISINRNFWIDPQSGNQYFVAVQYPEDPDRKIEDLKNIFALGTNQKTPVPLASLIDLHYSSEAVEIDHASLRRVTNVLVNTENRDLGSVAADISKLLKEMEVPRGMKVTLKGEYARMNESFRSLGIGLVLASVLVYLLMVPLMRSFVMPMIIMATVPLGLIGVLTMLFLTGTTLNVQSEMGVIFLVGIVVSQGVLLLDYSNQLRKQGLSAHDAITRAASIRFRPIMMTFLATFLDLLPMALGLGSGSEALTPLARAVVGGLLSSTFLTLLVIPILYTLLIRDPRHRHRHRHGPTESEEAGQTPTTRSTRTPKEALDEQS